ncbi:MAG: recombinase family protein [Actinobacteria bacterium]|nr:recombinase family protein [Actinomycetota bacterium]
MKLVAYIRVSTDRQTSDGLGLDVQREQIKTWAKANRHRIISWESDEGISGAKDFTDREGLATALQSICDGTAQGIVVAKLDRLARSLTVQEAALAHGWNCGGTMFSVDQGEVLRDDPDDPMRTAMRQVVGVFGQLERAMIAKRLRDGRRLKRERGGYADGAPSFGYRADRDNKQLAPDDAEQAALERIRSLRNDGASIRSIIGTLEAEGISTKQGKHWNPGTLSRLLRRMES